MKKVIAIFLSTLVLFSCEQESTPGDAPEIPPVETMIIDFEWMTDNSKSAEFTKTNWVYSAASVGIWNIIIGTTFAIPVASFKSAFGHEPTRVDDLTWEWTYSVDGFTSEYTARLLGKLESTQIKWEMYVTKTGIDSFDEFLWFEGTSQLDGESGQWILYHSAEFPEETVQIDWQKEAEEVGEIKYTYIRELNDERQDDTFNGSYLIYGLQDEVFDIYVTIHAYNDETISFADSFIEWSRSDYTGRVKSEQFYGDTDWHCWDTEGNDIDCN